MTGMSAQWFSRVRMSPFAGRAAQVLSFVAFAIAQPLFSVLADHPGFFFTKGADFAELVALSLFVVLGPFLLLFAVEVLAHATFGFRGLDLAHGGILVLLGVALINPLVKRTQLPDGWALGISVVGAMALAMGATRLGPLRRLTMVCAGAAPVFVLLFLFATPAGRVVAAGEPEPMSMNLEAQRTPPIVIFRTDEFPLSSIVGRDGLVDEVRFPNISALSQESVWYRNASTVSHSTRYAVPAMYTGTKPERWTSQVPSHHPRSVFTALGDVYTFRGSSEDVCPRAVCATARERYGTPGFDSAALYNVVSDGLAVYGHVVLPRGLASRLVPAAVLGLGPEWRVREFEGARATIPDSRWTDTLGQIRRLGPRAEPLFEIVSVLLPHRPWTLLHTGQTHSVADWNIPGKTLHGPWTTDPRPVSAAAQAHLAQVGAVDSLVGELTQRLRETGMYDEAMVVVISDHGNAFTPGAFDRDVKGNALVDVAAVPFFIKFPHQEHGRIDDRQAEVTDLFPTIVDVIGADPGWPMDGRSLLAPAVERRRTIDAWGVEYPIEADLVPRVVEAAKRKLALAGLPEKAEGNLETFYAAGARRDLIGRNVAAFNRGERSELRFRLVDASAYRDVSLDDLVLPAAVRAVSTGASSEAWIAAVVNKRIAAVRRLVEWERETLFDSLFWPGFLMDGTNEIAFFELGDEVLRPIRCSC